MSYLRPKNQYATPLTGATVAIDNDNADIRLVLNPAGTLATLTVTMPTAPFTGQVVSICTSQILTALTINGGTILGGVTTLPLNGAVSYVYESTSAKWYFTT